MCVVDALEELLELEEERDEDDELELLVAGVVLLLLEASFLSFLSFLSLSLLLVSGEASSELLDPLHVLSEEASVCLLFFGLAFFVLPDFELPHALRLTAIASASINTNTLLNRLTLSFLFIN